MSGRAAFDEDYDVVPTVDFPEEYKADIAHVHSMVDYGYVYGTLDPQEARRTAGVLDDLAGFLRDAADLLVSPANLERLHADHIAPLRAAGFTVTPPGAFAASAERINEGTRP